MGKRESFPLAPVVIGRDADCQLRFDLTRDLEVSGRHAEIVPGAAGVFEICDLESTNGTLVNGETIDKRHPLKPDDEIELGPGGPRLRFSVSHNIFQRILGLFGIGR